MRVVLVRTEVFRNVLYVVQRSTFGFLREGSSCVETMMLVCCEMWGMCIVLLQTSKLRGGEKVAPLAVPSQLSTPASPNPHPHSPQTATQQPLLSLSIPTN